MKATQKVMVQVKLADGVSTAEVAALCFGVEGLALGKSVDSVPNPAVCVYHIESGRTVGKAWWRTAKELAPLAHECYAGIDWQRDGAAIVADPAAREAVQRFEWLYGVGLAPEAAQ